MNEYHQIKRAAYYALLIVCLVAALLTLFLPSFSFYSSPVLRSWDHGVYNVNVFSYLHPGEIGKLLRNGYGEEMSVVSLGALLPGLLTAFFLLRSVFSVLRNLDREGSISTELRISVGPGFGAGLSALLILVGVFLSLSSADELHSLFIFSLSFWPFAGLLFNLCALRLAWVLNAERPRPAADQGCKNSDH